MRRKAAAAVFSIVLASTFLLAMVMAPAPAQAASWAQVSTGGGIDGNFNQMQTTASSMAVYGSLLYIGTEDITNGCEVWSHDGTNWTQVNTPGFGDANNLNASSMAVYAGNLYVGTNNNVTGCEVWKYDGSSWSQVNADGFGSALNTDIPCMEVFTTGDGLLYAGTGNGTAGCEVHQYNGTAWTSVSAGGFGSGAANYKASSMANFQGDLYVGTGNNTTGCEVHYRPLRSPPGPSLWVPPPCRPPTLARASAMAPIILTARPCRSTRGGRASSTSAP